MQQMSYSKITPVAKDNSATPAIDLVHPDFGLLFPDLARDLQIDGLDLSTLEPEVNNIYQGANSFNDLALDQSIDINSSSKLNFVSILKSPEGVMRFLVESDGKVIEVTLAKRLHTILLRKNVFRKLGYKIPASKWLESVNIDFKNKSEKDFFKKIQIFSETSASANRWVMDEGDRSLELRDVLVKVRSENEMADISLNMFPETLERRSFRASSLLYSFTNLNESINAFTRNTLRTYNGDILLEHDQDAVFQTSMDDLLWLARRLAALSKEDIKDVVRLSYFPLSVEKILINKLIDKRNQIVSELDLPFELLLKDELSIEGFEDGFLTHREFPSYATKFTFPEMEGPFDDFLNYTLAVSQETLIQGAMQKLNEKLQLFDLAKAKTDWLVNDFNENKDYALEYFEEFGEFPALPFAKWVSPTFGGGLILGRDLVIGSRLGTDNLVQLADSFGYALNLGLHVGLERIIRQNYTGSFQGNFRYMINYTHIKPVQKIKDYLGAPYRNMLVGLYKKSIHSRLEDMANARELDQDQARTVIKEARDYIDANFAVGESIIISENVTPDLVGSLQIPLFNSFTATISAGLKHKELKRIHLYRKSQNEFQLYFDDANLNELFAKAKLSNIIPFVNFNTARQKGIYKMKFFSFNLDPNINFNKNFYEETLNLVKILETRSLDGVSKEPIEIESVLDDKVSESNLLLFVNKSLKKLSNINVKFQDSSDFESTSYTQATYGKQNGINVKDFLKRSGNYILKKFVEDFDYEFDLNPFEEPSRTFLGSAKTTETEFQAKLKTNNSVLGFDELYLVTKIASEGSTISRKKLWKKLEDINERVGFNVYNENHSIDAGKLKLYNIETKVHLYTKSVLKLLNMNASDFDKLGSKVYDLYPYKSRCEKKTTIAKDLMCGNYRFIYRIKDKCQSFLNANKLNESRKCLAKLGYYITKYTPIKLLVELVGIDNIFIESSINGFRVGKETLYRPIYGNTYGRMNSKYTNGPIARLTSFLGIISSELSGSWFRKRL